MFSSTTFDSKWIVVAALSLTLVQCLPVLKEDGCYHKMADIVFALDSSWSIYEEDFARQLQFVKDIVNEFEIGDHAVKVGVVVFGSKVHHQFHLKDYSTKSSLQDAIERIEYIGDGTNTGSAIRYAREQMYRRENGGRSGIARLMVVVTDGLSKDTSSTAMEASLAMSAGIELFTIGIGNGGDAVKMRRELVFISSKPTEDHVFQVGDFNTLDSIKKSLTEKACQGMVADEPSAEKEVLEQEIRKHCGGKPADIFFVVDSSSSIWGPNFEKMLKFIQGVVDTFDLGPDKTRVGVVSFSSGIHPIIHLDNNFRKEELLRRIGEVPYLKGDTRTGTAIKYIREHGFAPPHVRPSVAHIAVILTDGQSADMQQTVMEAKQAHEEGIYLFALGIGDQTDAEELTAIASKPTEKFLYQMDDYDALSSIKNILAIKTCKADVQEDEKPLELTRHSPLDVMFVFDSYTLGRQNTDHVLSAIGDVVSTIGKVKADVQTGVLMQNCHQHRDLPLASYQNGDHFLSKLTSRKSSGLSGLVHKLRRYGYTSESGGRDNVQNVAVMFIDTTLEDYRDVIMEANRAKFRDFIKLFVVAIGDEDKTTGSKELCSHPVDDHFLSVSSYQELQSLSRRLLPKLLQVEDST